MEATKVEAFDRYRVIYCPWTGCTHIRCELSHCYLYTQVTALCSEDNHHGRCDGLVYCSARGVKIAAPMTEKALEHACLCVCHMIKRRRRKKGRKSKKSGRKK